MFTTFLQQTLVVGYYSYSLLLVDKKVI